MSFWGYSLKTAATCLAPITFPNIRVIERQKVNDFQKLMYTGLGLLAASAFTKPATIWRAGVVTSGIALAAWGFIVLTPSIERTFKENLHKWNPAAEGISQPRRSVLFHVSMSKIKMEEPLFYTLLGASFLTGYFWMHQLYFGSAATGHGITRLVAPLIAFGTAAYSAKKAGDLLGQRLETNIRYEPKERPPN